MQNFQNEKGYALVTVLLLITIFMVIFLSFMGQAFSSVKQNKVLEDSSQSVAVAEMGVNYFKVATQDIFERNRAEVNQEVNRILNPLPGEDFDSEEAKAVTVNATAEIIKNNLLLEQSPVTIEGRPNAFFSIDNIQTIGNTDSEKVEIKYTIIGTEEEKSTSLKADMEIDLSSIIINEDLINFVLPAFNEVPKPQPGCISFSNGCNELLVDGSQPLPGKTDNNGNNNGLSDKIVYSTGSLVINGNANNSYNLKVHAEDSFDITSNMNSATKLTMETKKNATFNGHLKVDSSRILIGGNLINGKHLDLDNNSFAFIGGNAAIEKLNITNNSTMCVQGTLTLPDNQKYIDPTSKLIVKQIVGEDEFEKQCGSPTSINLSINWGQNIETKIDTVHYE
ncbi:hypothetical protein M3181_12900 [Mesobacillus maritimus]|uniref:hypothetical protein n=1 Tax=Mesobacillus maritimus TaxID=1643336 RepID=UPI00203FAAB7|nr:hypothetical protein [Mesobacillus maritimus]MCM3669898.1 hypothetical protein [Mesobacillus maritimus]